MKLLRNKKFSVKYDPRTGKYEGKYSIGQRIGSAAAGAGIGAAGGLALGSLTNSTDFAKKAILTGAGIGALGGLLSARNSRLEKHNQKIDEKNNAYHQSELSRKTKNLPISYKEFQRRFPSQAKQLKDLGELGYYTDENPGDIEWFEQGGNLEKGRYLPISSRDDYNNLMFDTKTGKYVEMDSEELEPYPIKDIKSWANYKY